MARIVKVCRKCEGPCVLKYELVVESNGGSVSADSVIRRARGTLRHAGEKEAVIASLASAKLVGRARDVIFGWGGEVLPVAIAQA